MRTVGRFAITTKKLGFSLGDVSTQVTSWLAAKGTLEETGEPEFCKVTYRDGREARLASENLECSSGQLRTWALDEPSNEGRFRTLVAAASTSSEIAVSITLEAGFDETRLRPISFDVRCPRIFRSLLDLHGEWFVGGSIVRTAALYYFGSKDANELAALLRSQDRSLPVVLISEHHGFTLQPRLSEELAKELAGHALVAQIDTDASYGLTRELGKDWSCYNGAVRIYWPHLSVEASPFEHPLWTESRLLYGGVTTEKAAERFLGMCRRRFMVLSSFGIKPSPLIPKIREAYHREILDARRKEAEENKDYASYVKWCEDENARLHKRVQELQDELQIQRENFRLVTTFRQDEETSAELAPVEEPQPQTVTEAVERAMTRFKSTVIFGEDVRAGLDGVDPQSGPPDKIFRYLETLGALSEVKRAGPLGTTIVAWLEAKNVSCSLESDTISRNKKDRKKRTWHDGRAPRCFEWHLKPCEATSPDRCVRIYFDWDSDRKVIVVGWVGRHP